MNTLRLAVLDGAIDPADTQHLVDRLEGCLGDRRVALVTIERDLEPAKEFEDPVRALFDDRADIALCSASNLPLTLPEDVVIGALFRIHEPEYRCASRRPPSLGLLPAHSKVLSCDGVARAQILHRYPWLFVEAGPVSSELRDALDREVWDAACMPPGIAEAGTFSGMRLESVSSEIVIPTVGQGVACLVVRNGSRTLAVVRELSQPAVEACLDAEREFLRRLSGLGEYAVCTARATLDGERCHVTGVIAQTDGAWLVADQADGPAVFVRTVGVEVADSCAQLARKARYADEARLLLSHPLAASAGRGR